jgi:Fe-S-cluster containining protein
MNIKEFSYNLQKLYQEMSDSFSSYQSSTGWNCLPSCGKCCLNPEVDASILEMIPMAYSIYLEGKLDEWLDKLQTTKQEHCIVYEQGLKEGEGKCGRYNDRPSLCRMFGVSGHYNKQHEISLSVCKLIKEKYKLFDQELKGSKQETPMMADWSMKLASINPQLIQDKMPINKALLGALEKVAFTLQFQDEDSSH